MGLTDFSFRLLLLFIPGMIAFVTVDSLTTHRKVKVHHWVIYSFLLGIASYVIWFLGLDVFCSINGLMNPYEFLDCFINLQKPIQAKQLVSVSITAFFLGTFISFIINKKIFYKVMQSMNITNRYGDVDLFRYIMENNIPKWVYIRDMNSDRSYYGFITAWSGPDENDGIFLRDVKVYQDSTGEWCYDTPAIYLPKKNRRICY